MILILIYLDLISRHPYLHVVRIWSFFLFAGLQVAASASVFGLDHDVGSSGINVRASCSYALKFAYVLGSWLCVVLARILVHMSHACVAPDAIGLELWIIYIGPVQ